MSVLFDLELRMAISTQERYEGTGVCAMRRRIKVSTQFSNSARFAFVSSPKVPKENHEGKL